MNRLSKNLTIAFGVLGMLSSQNDPICPKADRRKYSESTSLQIQLQQWVDEHQLSMKDVSLKYFNNYKMVIDTNSSSVIYSYLSEYSNYDAP